MKTSCTRKNHLCRLLVGGGGGIFARAQAFQLTCRIFFWGGGGGGGGVGVGSALILTFLL